MTRPLPPGWRTRFLLAQAGTLLAACAPTLHPLPDRVETDPVALQQRADAVVASRSGLSAEARVEGRSRGSRLAGRATLLVRRDGRLRIDAFTTTDLWLATFLADSREVLYRARGEACRRGSPCGRNLSILVPEGWDLPAVCQALLGRPPVAHPDGRWRVSFDRKIGAWLLEGPSSDGAQQRVWIDLNERYRRFEQRRPDAPPLEWEIEEFDEDPKTPVRIRLRAGDDWVRLRLRNVEWNPEETPEDFLVECPGSPEWLPCPEETR